MLSVYFDAFANATLKNSKTRRTQVSIPVSDFNAQRNTRMRVADFQVAWSMAWLRNEESKSPSQLGQVTLTLWLHVCKSRYKSRD